MRPIGEVTIGAAERRFSLGAAPGAVRRERSQPGRVAKEKDTGAAELVAASEDQTGIKVESRQMKP
jgi:hypothetical protein